MVGIAQLVSAPDCGSGGPGFESLYPPFALVQIVSCALYAYPCGARVLLKGYRQAVRHRILIPAIVGSNLVSPVERIPCRQRSAGDFVFFGGMEKGRNVLLGILG